jgi:hypothetical protein
VTHSCAGAVGARLADGTLSLEDADQLHAYATAQADSTGCTR